MPKFHPKDHDTWKKFIEIRLPTIGDVSCPEYFEGLLQLDFSPTTIPDLHTISNQINQHTGWKLTLINQTTSGKEFFKLLAKKIFPISSKIRPINKLGFYDETMPDLIHDYFGHCPLLLNQDYANYLQAIGRLAIAQNHLIYRLIEKFYWFTIEFGLITTKNGLRIYGAGILPSIDESSHALAEHTERKELNLIDLLTRTVTHNNKQNIYYYIRDFKQLYEYLNLNWDSIYREVKDVY